MKAAKAYATTARLARKAVGAGGRMELARLPNAEAESLRWFFQDYGEQIGLRSSFGDMIQRLAQHGMSGSMAKCQTLSDNLTGAGEKPVSMIHVGSRPGILNDPFARLVERNTLQDIRRARAVFRRLTAMIAHGDGWAVTVLHRVYGPRPPGVDHSGVFGEVANVVEYTDEVEAQRIVMADALARDRLARWRIPLGSDREESVFAQALREVTTGDVIRAGVAPLHDCRRRKDETAAAHKKRLESGGGDVDRWAQPIRHQAIELLIRASNAFRATAAMKEAA